MPARSSADPSPARGPGAEFVGYLLASALALGVDTSTYAGALALGCPLPVAATAGFIAGVSCAYACSVGFVFRVRRLQDRALLWLFVQRLSIAPVTAKLMTAGPVFVFNFGVRKLLLFRRPTGPRATRMPLEAVR